MKVLVVYESMFGNSEQVARAITEGLELVDDVDLRNVATCAPGVIPEDVDLLVAGGPTHAMSMSRPKTRDDAVRQGAEQSTADRGLREWFAALPEDLDGLPFATFDTRVSKVRRLPGSAARAATRVLRRRRGRPVAAPESFYVDDVAGPLAEDQLAHARAWGQRLAELIADGQAIDAR